MKRVLCFSALFFVCFLLTKKIAAQAACPQFIDSTFRLLHPSGDPNPCDWQIRIEFYNPTMGVKSFKFLALCGSDTALNQCVNASNFKDSLRYDTSNVFTCCALSSLTVRLIAYTANSTVCIGASCTTTSLAGAPLPVYFKDFNATREGVSVKLKWSTASESNNEGFEIDRKIGNSDWISIGFVKSAAVGGTSVSDISYSFVDQNNSNETSFYRLKQIDLDIQFAYSVVRAVQGLKANPFNAVIFPNPGKYGQTKIVFADATKIYDLTLVDGNGRILKSWENIHSSSFNLTGLMPGWYNLVIVAKESGTKTVKKFIISK